MIQINYFNKLKKIVVLFWPMKKLLSELADFTEKYRKHITYALFFFSLVLVYQIYQSINSPIKFNQVKNERYLKVIDRLKDIRNAQVAFKSVNGIYSSSFDELIKFVDSAQFTICLLYTSDAADE